MNPYIARIGAGAAVAASLVVLALSVDLPARAEIDPRCFGETSGTDRWGDFTTWAGHFLDGGQLCDEDGPTHAGTSGADGVSAMDFDGDCDLDIITGWEESGRVFIYLNPTFVTRPVQGCPVKYHADNTQRRTDDIAGQWPAVEVTRAGHPNSPFSGVEDAVFADNDGDGVADYVVIATESGRMKTFVSFATMESGARVWHTFDMSSGDEYFMRAVVGNIDHVGCPDVMVGSKTVDKPPPGEPARTGDIRWWSCPAAWQPHLWKTGTALPDYGGKLEADYWKEQWGSHHLIATDIEWIMEMNIVNLVEGFNPNRLSDFTEILF